MQFVDPDRIEQSDHVQAASFAPNCYNRLRVRFLNKANTTNTFVQVSVYWYIGRALCDFWVSMDVLCCTASILHLVAIAIDRYWAVSNIDYIRRRCARQIIIMIAIVWFASVVISIPPLFGWRHDSDNPELTGSCMISQEHGYTIFSTVGAFYCPLIIMLLLNYKIYRAAKYSIRRKRFVGGAKHHLFHATCGITLSIPAVRVEEITNGQQRQLNGSEIRAENYSMHESSNVELSRINIRMESSTGEFEQRRLYYAGDSTTDSNSSPYDMYSADNCDNSDSTVYGNSDDFSDNSARHSLRERETASTCLTRQSASLEQVRPYPNIIPVQTPNFLMVPGVSMPTTNNDEQRISCGEEKLQTGQFLEVPSAINFKKVSDNEVQSYRSLENILMYKEKKTPGTRIIDGRKYDMCGIADIDFADSYDRYFAKKEMSISICASNLKKSASSPNLGNNSAFQCKYENSDFVTMDTAFKSKVNQHEKAENLCELNLISRNEGVDKHDLCLPKRFTVGSLQSHKNKRRMFTSFDNFFSSNKSTVIQRESTRITKDNNQGAVHTCQLYPDLPFGLRIEDKIDDAGKTTETACARTTGIGRRVSAIEYLTLQPLRILRYCRCYSTPDLMLESQMNNITNKTHVAVPESSEIADFKNDMLWIEARKKNNDKSNCIEAAADNDVLVDNATIPQRYVNRSRRGTYISREPSTCSESRLVQFNQRVKVEGNSNSSETSNSLKPEEDESGETAPDVTADGNDSADDGPVICCTTPRFMGFELACLSHGKYKHVSKKSQICNDADGVRNNCNLNAIPALTAQNHENPDVYEAERIPMIAIQRDSISHMNASDFRNAATPSIHSVSSPSTTTTTGGSSNSERSQQLMPCPANTRTQLKIRKRRANGIERPYSQQKTARRREKIEMRRERRAARVLGIVTGCFVLCWLPFFIVALIRPFLGVPRNLPHILMSLFLWLGYLNSLLNPIIYTVFNPSFRAAFRKMFFRRLKTAR